MGDIHIVKLGGSLLTLPDLPTRFERWRSGRSVIVVNGGGGAADLVREHCARYGIDDATGHDLAVQAMSFNTRLLSTLLPHARIVTAWDAFPDHPLQFIDAWPLLRDEPIPKVWAYTSDSIAAYVAHKLQAAKLTLLKSALEGEDLVDACFAQASAGLPSVELVNLRGDLRGEAFPSRVLPRGR